LADPGWVELGVGLDDGGGVLGIAVPGLGDGGERLATGHLVGAGLGAGLAAGRPRAAAVEDAAAGVAAGLGNASPGAVARVEDVAGVGGRSRLATAGRRRLGQGRPGAVAAGRAE